MIIRNQKKTEGGEALAGLHQAKVSTNLISIDAAMLRNLLGDYYLLYMTS
jgi:hypothetical protein